MKDREELSDWKLPRQQHILNTYRYQNSSNTAILDESLKNLEIENLKNYIQYKTKKIDIYQTEHVELSKFV